MVAYFGQRPLYDDDFHFLDAEGKPKRLSPYESRPRELGFDRTDQVEARSPKNLERLMLGPKAGLPRIGTEGGERRATLGMGSRYTTASDPPVMPVEPLNAELFGRILPERPVWALRAIRNWPILYPNSYLSTTDLTDYKLGVYGACPRIDASVDEIIARGIRLNRPSPVAEAGLSGLAKLVLNGVREELASLPAIFNVEARDLKGSGSALYLSLQHLLAKVSAGTTFSRVSLQDAYGAPGLELYDALREKVPLRRGLQQVLGRCEPPMEPTYGHIPLTREEYEVTLAHDPSAADRMVEMAGIPEHLPMIDAAAEMIPDGTFTGVHFVGVQHLLATQVTMFDALVKKGLSPAKSELIGVPYSTNYVCQHAFRMRGFRVETPDVTDPNDVGAAVERAVVPALERAIARSKADGKPILILDDGGKISLAIHQHFAGEAHRFRLVEQTTRGITEINSLPKLLVSSVDVANAPLKSHEIEKIGDEVAYNIDILLGRISMMPLEGRRVTVMGYGRIGRGVAEALAARGAMVTVYDTDPARLAEAHAVGYRVANDKAAALSGHSLVVGCSGKRSITKDDLQHLDHEAVLVSASSRDVEIDLSINRNPDVLVVPLLAEGPGDRRFTTRVWRFPDKDIVVLRNGFPVNFNGALETGSFESIQATRAMMLLGAAQALRDPAEPKLRPLDELPQRILVDRFKLSIPALRWL